MQVYIYRGTIWLWLIVDVFQFVMMVFLWRSVYQYNDVINGFSLNQMLMYFLLTNLFYIFTENNVLYTFSSEIKEGKISLYLTKPISYYGRLLFETLGDIIGVFMLLVPIVCITAIVLTQAFNIVWAFSIIHVLIALLFIPLIIMLMFEFNYIFGTLSIHTTNVFGLAIFMNVFIRVTSGQLLPIAFYPNILKEIIGFMPFRFISYPPLIIMQKITTHEALIGLMMLFFWVILFRCVSYLIYKASIKKMVVFGG